MFRYLLAAMFWFSMPVSATEPVVPPPTPTQILALPAELRADFHQRVLDVERSPPRRLEQLVDYLFLPTGLGMHTKSRRPKLTDTCIPSRPALECLHWDLRPLAALTAKVPSLG